jgi:hypothetical protein
MRLRVTLEMQNRGPLHGYTGEYHDPAALVQRADEIQRRLETWPHGSAAQRVRVSIQHGGGGTEATLDSRDFSVMMDAGDVEPALTQLAAAHASDRLHPVENFPSDDDGYQEDVFI